MVAKVVTWGETREVALLRLGDTLARTKIAPLVTNSAFVQKVLKDEAFRGGEYDTKFAEVFAKKGP